KLIKGKQPKWYNKIRDLISRQENLSISEERVNLYIIINRTKNIIKGVWIQTNKELIGKVKSVKDNMVTLSHWNKEDNIIRDKYSECKSHIATKMTTGLIRKQIKNVTRLMVNQKKRIYKNLEEINKAFRMRKKKEEEYPKEIFMSKIEKKSWNYIKNFKNVEEILWKKHREIAHKKKREYEVIVKKANKEKKTNTSIIIIDKDGIEVIKIENETWLSEEKIEDALKEALEETEKDREMTMEE
ncbi:15948_t:CDS:2, partial [Gigaspora margarita]